MRGEPTETNLNGRPEPRRPGADHEDAHSGARRALVRTLCPFGVEEQPQVLGFPVVALDYRREIANRKQK